MGPWRKGAGRRCPARLQQVAQRGSALSPAPAPVADLHASQLHQPPAATTCRRQFFQSGKTLPIQRGAGPDQPIIRTVAREVAAGRWLHVFPEGRVNYTGELGTLRWGVGKIICDAVGLHDGK